MTIRTRIGIVATVTSLALSANLGVPRTIAYQGRLTDGSGNPVADGNYNLNFTIWNDPVLSAIGNMKWQSGAVSVATASGLFNVNLGAPGQAVLPDTVFLNDTTLYLGISINGGAEITPRTKLTSVAYSYVAGTVPDSSLYATKTINEAGLTYASIFGTQSVPYSAGGTLTDMAVVSITVPTGGFIVVRASGQVGMAITAGLDNIISFQIDQTAGGFEDLYQYYYVGTDNSVNSNYWYRPISAQKVYYIFSAGTYTFRLEARSINSAAFNYMWSPVITAEFFPTYYGMLIKSSTPGGGIDTAYVDGAPELQQRQESGPMPQPSQKQ